MPKLKRYLLPLSFTLLLLVLLPVSLLLFDRVKSYLARAAAKPADIKIHTDQVQGPLPQVWRAIAQGGEERGRTFQTTRDEIMQLNPRYVRIDHIYDIYEVVKRGNGRLALNWNKLDQTVFDILSAGSKPFFSLSYMPSALAEQNKLTDKPTNWQEWEWLVKKTIEHYSGRKSMNLKDVYYEVWNEPDLFGNWKTYGSKNYLDLYYFSAQGAAKSINTNNFYLGGPATTAPYRNWMTHFLRYVQQGNLRLDFLSWHRYSTDPLDYRKDIIQVENWIQEFTHYSRLPKIISEFSYDSEINQIHDTKVSAAHTAAVIRQTIPELEMAFTFELQDGLSPQDEEFWGRWGVLTHSQFGNTKKPRFFALKLLNKLGGKFSKRMKVDGEGDFVKAIAARENSQYRVLLVNYDPQDKHTEQTPLTFHGLGDGTYTLSITDLSDNTHTITKQSSNGKLTHSIILPPNSVVLVTLYQTPGV